MGDKKVLSRETKTGVFEMNLEDFLKVAELIQEQQEQETKQNKKRSRK